MRGFTQIVLTVFLLIALSLLIGAYYEVLSLFLGEFDPLTAIMFIFIGPSMIFGIIFLEKNKNEILRGR